MSPSSTVDDVDPRKPHIWHSAAALFHAWREGDAGAFDDLVRLLSPVLWQVVRAYRLPPETAEDTVQTVWLTLVRRRDQIADPQAVGGWLIVTARRAASSAYRADERVTSDAELPERPSAQNGPEPTAVLNDEAERLWRCLSEMSERCQALLRVLAFDDRPDYAHLAQRLHMPIGSIGPTRGRCLDKLRAEWERTS